MAKPSEERHRLGVLEQHHGLEQDAPPSRIVSSLLADPCGRSK